MNVLSNLLLALLPGFANVGCAARADDPYARYDRFMKQHPNFSVRVHVAAGDKALGDARVTLARAHGNQPGRFRLTTQDADTDYEIASTGSHYVEVERKGKVYDELSGVPPLQRAPSRISDLANLVFPSVLMVPSLKSLIPSGGKPTVHRVAGGDEIALHIKDSRGEIDLKVLVDPEGRLARVFRHTVSMQGDVLRTWTFTNYQNLGPLTEANFRLPLPLGYVAYALPTLTDPLPVGQAAPVSGWIDGATRRSVDFAKLAKGRPFLIAVLGNVETPDVAARASVAALKAHLPVYTVGLGGYADPSGKLLARLNPPATPMFYLVDAAGKVAHLWMGYDMKHAAAFEAEVKQAAR